MSKIDGKICLRVDGLRYNTHDLQQINDTTLKCYWCKKYFREVDVSGDLIA